MFPQPKKLRPCSFKIMLKGFKKTKKEETPDSARFKTMQKDIQKIEQEMPSVTEMSPEVRRIIHSIILQNNRNADITFTYHNKKNNKCGLDWHSDQNGIVIKQLTTFDKLSWYAIGLFTEYSIVQVEWQVLEVPYYYYETEAKEVAKYAHSIDAKYKSPTIVKQFGAVTNSGTTTVIDA